MTRGLHRFQQNGNFHFITFSCYHRQPNLRTAATRHLFESALERIRQRYQFVVIGYVVMPEHVHLLVNEPRINTLDRAIQALKLSVVRRTKMRPFWQTRYYDFNVWNPEKTTEKLRYMHRNPVARGLVAQPEDWPWSSFRHYATGVEGAVQIESFWTAAKRGNESPAFI
ncbi:MAG: transposase [Acidobacteria bacterium]|nr:transposase [Acidobacteriota bacterium]